MTGCMSQLSQHPYSVESKVKHVVVICEPSICSEPAVLNFLPGA